MPGPTIPADYADRTESTLTKQPDFQMAREATRLLAGGELQPKRAVREDVAELSFNDDIYDGRKAAAQQIEAQTATRERPIVDVSTASARIEAASQRSDSVSTHPDGVSRRDNAVAKSDQNTQEVFDNVQKHLLDALNGHPDDFQRSIKKLFDHLSHLLGFDSKPGGGSGGGGSSWDVSGGRGGHGREHEKDHGGRREHERNHGRQRYENNGFGTDDNQLNQNNAAEKLLEPAPYEPGIDFIQPQDVPHQLWRTFRQNGFPAIDDDSLVAENKVHHTFDATPGRRREAFCDDQNLNTFRDKLSDFNRQAFDAEFSKLVGKYQQFEQLAGHNSQLDSRSAERPSDRVESSLFTSDSQVNGQTVLDEMAKRLDDSPILDFLDKSRIKFLEQSVMTGDVQNIMLLLNADDDKDLNLAMAVLDREMRPLGISVDYRMENGVGNMYVRSSAERGFIRINENEAEMHDGRGHVDNIFSAMTADSGDSGSIKNETQTVEDESYRQYYLRYRDEIRAGMPVVSYEDYMSMHKSGCGDDFNRL